MDSRLQNRVAIITGAMSGLGRATAIRFANSGARIVCADLRPGGTEVEINDKHGEDRSIFVKCDVTQESEIENMVNEAVKWAGRLDIICNYAGISSELSYDSPKRVHEVDVKDYDRSHSVNARGVWLCCKYALKQMMAQEPGERTRGWIVNAASIYGLVATPLGTCYVPSKHAVVGMTKQMALDYAQDRIHVNCVCPGFAKSPMIQTITADPKREKMMAGRHPWNALGTAEDIADAALFLASDEAAWVTGHSLAIDGGYTCQ